jgi:hypothetical protein
MSISNTDLIVYEGWCFSTLRTDSTLGGVNGKETNKKSSGWMEAVPSYWFIGEGATNGV